MILILWYYLRWSICKFFKCLCVFVILVISVKIFQNHLRDNWKFPSYLWSGKTLSKVISVIHRNSPKSLMYLNIFPYLRNTWNLSFILILQIYLCSVWKFPPVIFEMLGDSPQLSLQSVKIHRKLSLQCLEILQSYLSESASKFSNKIQRKKKSDSQQPNWRKSTNSLSDEVARRLIAQLRNWSGMSSCHGK